MRRLSDIVTVSLGAAALLTLVYAKDTASARWKVIGRGHVGLYHVRTRRALADEVAS